MDILSHSNIHYDGLHHFGDSLVLICQALEVDFRPSPYEQGSADVAVWM